MKKSKRESTVIRTSILSILANLILVGFRATVGFMSNSIAIITDAVNDRESLYQHIYDEIHAKYPDYELHITLDIDVSD